jgi:hypothetical protein
MHTTGMISWFSHLELVYFCYLLFMRAINLEKWRQEINHFQHDPHGQKLTLMPSLRISALSEPEWAKM